MFIERTVLMTGSVLTVDLLRERLVSSGYSVLRLWLTATGTPGHLPFEISTSLPSRIWLFLLIETLRSVVLNECVRRFSCRYCFIYLTWSFRYDAREALRSLSAWIFCSFS